MIKAVPKILSCFILIIGFTSAAQAQFINLQIKIEPELSATVESNLNFGTQISNSGRTAVQLGDFNMGVFSIRAFHTQNVYLSLEYPNALQNNEAGVNAEIPLGLTMSYNNSGNNNPARSIPLDANQGFVSVHENTQLEFDNDIWKELYIYVYGYIEVGNIPNGVYVGDIILSVDYD